MKMYGIEILLEEHKNILKFVNFTREECKKVLNGADIDVTLFKECVSFGKNYADHHHHVKEEEILFKKMTEHLGKTAETIIKNGMLVEHDLGRLYISELETALNRYETKKDDDSKLDIISYMTAYGHLLNRHIDKENNAVYTFAERQLNVQLKEEIDKETKVFDEIQEEIALKEKALAWLNTKTAIS